MELILHFSCLFQQNVLLSNDVITTTTDALRLPVFLLRAFEHVINAVNNSGVGDGVSG